MKRGNHAIQFETNAGAVPLNHLSAKCDKHPLNLTPSQI